MFCRSDRRSWDWIRSERRYGGRTRRRRTDRIWRRYWKKWGSWDWRSGDWGSGAAEQRPDSWLVLHCI